MIEFNEIVTVVEPGYGYTPYAGKDADGNWIEGEVGVDFLNANFGKYTTATEMKVATTSEGLHLYFDYLVEQGKLPA